MKVKKIDRMGGEPILDLTYPKWFAGLTGWSGLQVLEGFGTLVSWTAHIDHQNQLGDYLKPASGMLGDQLHQFKPALCRLGELDPAERPNRPP